MFRFVLAACSVSSISVLVYALVFVGEHLLLLSICMLLGAVSTTNIFGMWMTEDSEMLSEDSFRMQGRRKPRQPAMNTD